MPTALGDGEMQLQAEYGLWLYHLRSGKYVQAAENGKKMADLATQAGDYGALLTAAAWSAPRCIFPVSSRPRSAKFRLCWTA
ncbi:Uncharacterised protein [Cedecea neteri]|uniref:Sel1 repeat n=1 Tax=Cedecea neteri TaxID=158822 RepID=A0A2X3L5D8_9ENTR|nr:Uncharacterised protein [Cedecea neteri]